MTTRVEKMTEFALSSAPARNAAAPTSVVDLQAVAQPPNRGGADLARLRATENAEEAREMS